MWMASRFLVKEAVFRKAIYMRRISNYILLAVVCFVYAGAMPGAEVVLKSGDKRLGKLVKQDDTGVTLEDFDGVTTIPQANISKVREKTKSKYEEYLELAAKAGEEAKGHVKLAVFCILVEAWKRAAEHVAKAEALAPDDAKVVETRRALEDKLDEIAIAAAKEKPEEGLTRIPHKDGEWLIKGSDRRWYVQVPKSISSGKALPVVLNFNWRVTTSPDGIKGVKAEWRGFDGLVVTVIDKYSVHDPNVAIEILDQLKATFSVDAEAVLVVSWRGSSVFSTVGQRPDIFRYGYDDSTWGGTGDRLPGVSVPTGAMLEHARKVHVCLKLTGEMYKPEDHGYNDEKMKKIEDAWKKFESKNIEIARYPGSTTYPEPNYNCIGQNVGGRAMAWFARKLKERADAAAANPTKPNPDKPAGSPVIRPPRAEKKPESKEPVKEPPSDGNTPDTPKVDGGPKPDPEQDKKKADAKKPSGGDVKKASDMDKILGGE